MSGQLEEGVGSVCHGYMCNLPYVQLIWCSDVAKIYGQLDGGHLSLVYVHLLYVQLI